MLIKSCTYAAERLSQITLNLVIWLFLSLKRSNGKRWPTRGQHPKSSKMRPLWGRQNKSKTEPEVQGACDCEAILVLGCIVTTIFIKSLQPSLYKSIQVINNYIDDLGYPNTEYLLKKFPNWTFFPLQNLSSPGHNELMLSSVWQGSW